MAIEVNKAIVIRYLDMWNTGNTMLAEEVLAPTWIDHVHLANGKMVEMWTGSELPR